MEKNDHNVARWVDERLAALAPPTGFHPNAPQALARVRERDRAHRVTRRRWLWVCAAAAALCFAVMAVPAPCRAASASSCGQPIATRLWDSVFRKPPLPPTTFVTAQAPVPAPAPAPAVGPSQPVKPAPAPPDRISAASFKESGSPAAPITCEIYSDYECPSCAVAFRETIPLLEEQFVRTGKVRLLHRDFPLRQHPYARLAARYANAAGRAGAYSLVVNRLFQTQNQWAPNGGIESQLAPVLSPSTLRRVAELVKDPQFDDTVDADLAMALQDHINRTPSIVIVSPGRRQVIAGIPTFDFLKGYLEDLLSRK